MDKKINGIVLNVPHTNTALPHKELWSGNIDKHINIWTDWFTDVIFKPKYDDIPMIVFPYSRFYCDAERLVGDELEKIGQGIYYTDFEECHRVKGRYYNEVMAFYHTHQNSLAVQLKENSLLIDCHSFPSKLSDVDFCIGYNEDKSKPSSNIIELIKTHFEDLGYKVGINTPYSNSITPLTDFKYYSIMIEINKGIYLYDDRTLRSDAYKINHYINNLYKKLKEYGTIQ